MITILSWRPICWFNNIATQTIDHDCKIPCFLLRFLFLMWTALKIKVPLILRVGRKWKGRAGNNYKSTLNIEFEQDGSTRCPTLDATLGDREKIKKNIILVTRIFLRKSDSAVLLGFKCTINPQNLMKIVRAIFEKMKILIFFSYLNYP